jgi:carboxypeptidase Taq
MGTEDLLQDFNRRLDEIANLGAITAILDWDQNCCMPEAAASGRAAQLELMSTLSHQRLTDSRFWEITQELSTRSTLSEADKVNVRETKRHLERQRKLPAKFVAEQARERALCFDVWSKAKPLDKFEEVAPHLEKIVDLVRQEAHYVGYQDHPYDAMLDVYEPGAKLAGIKPVLSELGEALAPRVARWQGKLKGPNLKGCTFPKAAQEELGKRLWQRLGLEAASARLDVSPHPFSTRLGPSDFRITTRYSEA